VLTKKAAFLTVVVEDTGRESSTANSEPDTWLRNELGEAGDEEQGTPSHGVLIHERLLPGDVEPERKRGRKREENDNRKALSSLLLLAMTAKSRKLRISNISQPDLPQTSAKQIFRLASSETFFLGVQEASNTRCWVSRSIYSLRRLPGPTSITPWFRLLSVVDERRCSRLPHGGRSAHSSFDDYIPAMCKPEQTSRPPRSVTDIP
jgi:hypothetical protein